MSEHILEKQAPPGKGGIEDDTYAKVGSAFLLTSLWLGLTNQPRPR